MKLKEWADQQGVTYGTAWGKFKRGEIPGAVKLPNGKIEVPGTPPLTESEKIILAIDELDSGIRSLHIVMDRLIKKVDKHLANGVK